MVKNGDVSMTATVELTLGGAGSGCQVYKKVELSHFVAHFASTQASDVESVHDEHLDEHHDNSSHYFIPCSARRRSTGRR